MSLRSTDEWHGHSHMNMTDAGHAHTRAKQTCHTSLQTHNDCLAENVGAYHDLHHSLGSKVKASQDMILALESRARSVQKTLDATKRSLVSLEAARKAKDAPLELCTWRMEQREKRPLRELVRDSAELALEEERHHLLECQRRLAEGEKRTRAMIIGLEDALQELHADISDKRQALNIDDMCLRTTHRPWQPAVDFARPASMAMTTQRATTVRKTPAEESGRNEQTRQAAASSHNKMAAHKES